VSHLTNFFHVAAYSLFLSNFYKVDCLCHNSHVSEWTAFENQSLGFRLSADVCLFQKFLLLYFTHFNIQ